MPVNTIYVLGESQITISSGGQLSGFTQGDGSHLNGLTITLNSDNWEAVDVFDQDANFQDSDGSQRLVGAQVFDGTLYPDNRRVEAEYGVTAQDPDGNIYTLLGFNINEGGGASFGTVEGLAFVGGVGGFPPVGVPLVVIDTFEGPSAAFADLATPACFTAGSLILTPNGAIPAENLEVGDPVLTMDNGLQDIRWIGRTRLPRAILKQRIEFRPVLIRKDAFGPDRPNRDIRFSQQHRVFVSDWRAEFYCASREVLIPAKKLVNDHSICVDHTCGAVEYIHLLFDNHEIIWADGLPSESFLPGPMTQETSKTQAEALALFPELAHLSKDLRTARPCFSDKRAAVIGASAA